MSSGAVLMAQTSLASPKGEDASDEEFFGQWNPASRPEQAVSDSVAANSLPTPPSHESPPTEPSSQRHDDSNPSLDGNNERNNDVKEGRFSPDEESNPILSTTSQTPGRDVQQNATTTHETETLFGTEDGSPDPFEELNFTARTNSFPEFSQANGSAQTQSSNDPAPAPESGPPPPEEIDGPKQDDARPLKRSSMMGDNDDGYSFFDHSNVQTKPIYNFPEAESRFEEGVPLMSNSNPSSPVETQRMGAIDDIFEQDEVEDDTGFFNSAQAAEPPKSPGRPPGINRKSTSQVLGSLDFHDESPSDFLASLSQQQDGKSPAAAEPPANEPPPEEDLEERWKAALGDDDFLMDDDDGELLSDVPSGPPQGQPGASDASAISHENVQQGDSQPPPSSFHQPNVGPQFGQPRTNLYTPHQPSSHDLVSGMPFAQPTQPIQTQAPETPSEKPVSYSNQSKAGYQSPYDLPMDIRPKRAHPSSHATSSMVPPPRSSSMTGTRPTSSSSSNVPPPPPVGSLPRSAEPPPGISPEKRTGPPSNFFEELPTSSRSRPSTRGRYTPQPTAAPADTTEPNTHSPTRQPSNTFNDSPPLQKPEPADPYSSLPVPPPQSSRYSPKPPSLQSGSGPSPSRYSPAPPPQSGGPNKYMSTPPNLSSTNGSLPFQPRTSSPLAQHEENTVGAPQARRVSSNGSSSYRPFQSSNPPSRDGTTHPAPSEEFKGFGNPPGDSYFPRQPPVSEAMDVQPRHLEQIGENTASVYPPMSQSAPDSQIFPPKRSMTQSPGKRGSPYTPAPIKQDDAAPRPASVHGSGPSNLSTNRAATSRSDTAPQLDFIPPTDGQELDPFERWKGAPIFKFGFGGAILTSFPTRTPLYSSGHVVPKLKTSLGDIKTQQISESFIDSAESSPKFPGPLKSKSKKKEVLTWLSSMIATFEDEARRESYSDAVGQQQREEKLLLWKVMRVLVEHDGALEGTPEIEKSLQDVLSPASDPLAPPSQQADGPGIYAPIGGTAQPEPGNPAALESIRNSLLTGAREQAVWDAVNNRLWGHALLLSSTLDKSIWKQVAQEFVRREVKSLGENTESLAALYEVFAGNVDESIDELVPVSARAGLQMVNKNTTSGPTRNPLDGLNKWRETLSLMLSNRSPEYHRALLALSRLLSSYGRIEAAHVCSLLASPGATNTFGGIQDPQATVVLLGADHHHHPSTFMHDRNALRLTEVYEFAVSVLAGSPSSVLPHFQSFKLEHAYLLADEGHKSEAQQYCDSIGALLKATTRPSPYYHQVFGSKLDELSNRLRQAPSDGSSSWISRPSIGGVSGSIMAKFNSFVAGDDSDAVSTGSGKGADADVGPFSKMVGTPPISRSPSVPDSSFAAPHQQAPAPASASRYAPAYRNPSPEQNRGRQPPDPQRSPSYGTPGGPYQPRHQSQEPPAPIDGQYLQAPMYGAALGYGVQTTPAPTSHAPLEPVQEVYSPQTSVNPAAGFGPVSPQQPNHQDQTGDGLVSPTQGGYEPPSMSTGYQPPSYEPPSAGDEHEEKPKKKAFPGDDDGDAMPNDEQTKQAERDKRNREASEAIKKAAEEDEKKKDSAPSKTGSWIRNWLPLSRKEGSSPAITAKLGEENSFYFDEDLQRWVNKKDPDSFKSVAQATPPPPMGSAPQSRSSSGPRPQSKASTASAPPPSFGENGHLAPPRGISPHVNTPPLPPTASPNLMPRSVSSPGGADSRPGSQAGPSLSNASSIDDLIGAPQARKGNTVKSKKKGRGYVDIMAK